MSGSQPKALGEFQKWIQEDPRQRSQRKLGGWLGISATSVGCWLFGRSRPEPHLRLAIEILTDGRVAADDWALDEERAYVEAKRRQMTGTDG